MKWLIQNYKVGLLCFISSIFLMGIWFYNGYPLYGGETHSYLHTAFTHELSADRPPFYAGFLGVSSLSVSLWVTVFSQCFILSCLLVKYISLFKPERVSFRFDYICMLSIAAFTCVSWVCSYLIPDIFTGVLLLAILLYLFDEKASGLSSLLYVFIIVVAVVVHNSHFLLCILFSLSILIYALIKKHRVWVRKSLGLVAIGIFFYFLMCSLNYHKYGKFIFSPSAQLFITAKFASNGILDKYLEDKCGKKKLRLCNYKGQIPKETYAFMWPEQSSPLFKIDVWGDSSSREFKEVNYDIFTTPKYLKMYAQNAAVSTVQQLGEVSIEHTYAFPLDNWKILFVKTYFPDEYKWLMASKQNKNEIEVAGFNLIYLIFFIVSSIFILLLYAPAANKKIYLIYGCIAVYFVINAYVTSNFSMVSPRFQNRVFWILPATNAILILKYLQNKYKEILK